MELLIPNAASLRSFVGQQADPVHPLAVLTKQLVPLVLLGVLTPTALSTNSTGAVDSGCDSLPNSLGEKAVLEVTGEAVLPGGHLTLEAYPVPNEPTLLFYSTDSNSGTSGAPFADGLSCLGSDGRRVSVLPVARATNHRLQVEIDIDELAESDAGIHAGTELRFQGWYRDSSAAQSPFNFTTSSQVHLGSVQYKVLQLLMDDIGFEFLRTYHDQNKYDGDNPFNTLEDVNGKNLYPWTPFIDELASKGIRFNQYRTNPTCSTTRATLLTGRYAFRHGVGALITEDRVGDLGEFGVGPGNDEFTIAEVISSAGYETGYVGKWHMALGSGQVALGGLPGLDFPHILSHGKWDYAWSIHANLTNWPFVPPVNIPGVSGSFLPEDDVVQGYWNFQSWANFGSDPFETPFTNLTYASEMAQVRTKDLIDWVETGSPSSPWYVLTSFPAAHSPYGDLPDTNWLTTAEYWPRETIYGLAIPGGSGPPTAWSGYCAHIEALDNRLEEMFTSMGGLDNVLLDTMVFLMGDNGGPPPALLSAINDHGKDIGSVYSQTITSNNHFKHQPYEQGTRVPFIVAGPLVANPGTTSYIPIDSVDVHTTISDICQADVSSIVNDGRAMDGVSFLPRLNGTVGDLEYIKTVRDWSFVERFSPNGDPRSIVPPIANNHNSRRRGFVLRIKDNWFKVIRKLGDDGLEADELYHLYNTEVPSIAGEVDPNELNDLVNDPQYAREYGMVVDRLEALLASEP